MAIITYQAEYTDTFGGEANYSWVQRRTFEASDKAPNHVLVRRAKKAVGLCGRHRTEDIGDIIAVYPRGSCTVLFITPKDA